MPKVISIGNTCLDIILAYTNQLPEWNSELVFEEAEWRLGGQGANFAIASAYLGLKTILVSNIGNDDVGNRLRTELASALPICKHLFRCENSQTGFSVTLIHQDGERSFLTFLGHQRLFPSKSLMNDVLNVVESDDVVHISGLYMLPRLREKLPALVRQLHSKGARISLDPGWNPHGFTRRARGFFYRTLSYVDFYEPNDAELKQLTGERTVQSALLRIMSRFHGVLVVKLGKRGSAIVEPGRRIFAPPFAARVADTTGAGDAFDAGFLAGVTQDRTLEISAKMGNAVASIMISRRGKASLRFPKYKEVHTLMKGANTLFKSSASNIAQPSRRLREE